MVKKRGVRKKLIIIFCLGGMMFFPLSVYGSTQPDDIEVSCHRSSHHSWVSRI